MKYFFTFLIATILFSGCATRNAFSKLEITHEQELSIENTRTGQIKSGLEIGGVFSAVYLNGVYPDINKPTFYISSYVKDERSDLNITLNQQTPFEITTLPEKNKFAHLSAVKNKWINNYLVTFHSTKNQEINLIIESGRFSSGLLSYPTE